MKPISILAVCLSLYASSAFATTSLIPPTLNTASSGDAGMAVVHNVTLANGTFLAVVPTR
jgi:hypothetical protein